MHKIDLLERKRVQLAYNEFIEINDAVIEPLWDSHQIYLDQIEAFKKIPNMQFQTNQDEQDTFLIDSFVFTPEDDIRALCYYCPDGQHMVPIVMEHVRSEALELEDIFYDYASFMQFYAGYERSILCARIA